MEINRKNQIRTALFAGILIAVLAGCSDLTGSFAGPGEETIPEGMGLARINLGAGGRTVLPDISGLWFTLDFNADEKTTVSENLSGGSLSLTVALEPAVWTLDVRGYGDAGKTQQKVSVSISVPITAGTASSFDVYLTPDFAADRAGSLAYSIGVPSEVWRAWLGLYPIDASGTSQEIDISESAGGTASGVFSDLPTGSYRAVIDLYDKTNNNAAICTEVVHIYDGLSTSLSRGFTGSDFAECPPQIGTDETTLAAKLDAALAAGGEAYTIVLDGTETDLASFTPKSLYVEGNRNISITLRGGGRTVQVSATGTSLLTLGADSGSSLTLVLYDLTLQGSYNNTVSVVRVNSRGTLFMKAGSSITGNTASSSSYGGGVYVAGSGTFTMSGGAISGNTASYGGGVYVADSGTFTMSGGAISGNTASPYDSSSGGGGVYVAGSGTFTMSGGAISGNTASCGGGVYVADSGTFTMSGGAISGNTASSSYSGSASSYGGGVYVADSGTFTMFGGAISGNTAAASSSSYSGSASSYGGGVYVRGTFTMSGGAISGNTASSSSYSASSSSASSYGGGVYVRGTFTMSGGAISGNTYSSYSESSFSSSSASSYGGGVYVADSGTFTMFGGAISGNTASYSSSYSYSASSYGGGVYVADSGTFTMFGGAISGNTASTTSSSSYYYSASYGGGVYVADSGTFTMFGGAISGNTASSSYRSSYGGGVYVADSGTFTMSGGAVRGNTASSSDSSYGGGVYVADSGTFTMSGGAVRGNRLSGGSIYGREVCVWGAFKMSGEARPQRVLLYYSSVTIAGPLNGGITPIDLGDSTMAILKLDDAYTDGDLASLKYNFSLGNFEQTNSSITGYTISDDGFLVAE